MAEDNEQETFTFVDKRRAAADPETVSEPQAQPEAGPEQLHDNDDALEAGAGDTLGSYGLAAYITGLIASDAWQKMGLVADPATGNVIRDLAQAKFSIDCVTAIVGLLEQRQSALPPQLLCDLQRVLNDLRLNFIEQSRR